MCNYFCTCATLHTHFIFHSYQNRSSRLTTLVYNMCVGYIITLYWRLQQTWISALVFTQNQLLSLVAARRETFLSFLRLSAVRLVFCTINGSISTISRLSTPIHGRCLLLTKSKNDMENALQKSSLATGQAGSRMLTPMFLMIEIRKEPYCCCGWVLVHIHIYDL
jgi:hypothetical protein